MVSVATSVESMMMLVVRTKVCQLANGKRRISSAPTQSFRKASGGSPIKQIPAAVPSAASIIGPPERPVIADSRILNPGLSEILMSFAWTVKINGRTLCEWSI